jgi:hypothetical protein
LINRTTPIYYCYNNKKPPTKNHITATTLQTSTKSVTITIVAALYGFTAFTFTSANLKGRTGPTLTQSLASYNTATNTWLNNTAYFNIVTQGIQQWTVPATGTYRLVLRGADGGGFSGSTFNPRFPGQGATITCDVSLTISTVLNIVVGQTPAVSGGGTGIGGTPGGGGTWIYTGTIGGGGLIAALLLPTSGLSRVVPLVVAAAYLLIALVLLRPVKFHATF